jgi:hypothetical protein
VSLCRSSGGILLASCSSSRWNIRADCILALHLVVDSSGTGDREAMPRDYRHPSTKKLIMLTVEFSADLGVLLHPLDSSCPGVLFHPPVTSCDIVVEPATWSVRVAYVAVDISLVLQIH